MHSPAFTVGLYSMGRCKRDRSDLYIVPAEAYRQWTVRTFRLVSGTIHPVKIIFQSASGYCVPSQPKSPIRCEISPVSIII